MKQINGIYSKNYYLTQNGQVYDKEKDKYLKSYSHHSYKLRTIDNEYKSISLKKLYRQVYNKEFCIDNIQNLQGQEWLEVKQTNGLYFVSNLGRVKSYQKYQAAIIKPMKNENGYLRVQLFFNGVMKNVLVSRLVASQFIEEPQNILLYQLHHINRNKQDNRVSNLIWLRTDKHKDVHNFYKFLDKYQKGQQKQ